MQPRKERFFLDSKPSFNDPTTTLPTLEAFDCPFVDDDDNKRNPMPALATSPSTGKGAIDTEDRGAHTSPDKGSFPEVETPDDCNVRDGTLRPGFGRDETSPRCLIDDHRIAKICPINAKLEKRFFNGKWYPGAVISGPYQFDDEMPVTARWEIAFNDRDHEFLSTDELQDCRISHRPTHVDKSAPTVETVTEDDDDAPYSSPMDNTPLDQRPEVLFPDKDEDVPPHLPRPHGAPNPEETPQDFSGQFLHAENPVLPNGLPPDKMIDRTFLMPPEEDGTRHQAKIIALIDSHLAENNFEKQPERVKFKCLVNEKYEEAVTHNNIVNYIEADDTWDRVWKFCHVLDHKCVMPSNKNYMQCSVNILIEWESGKTSWQQLHCKDKAVTVAIYARENNLLGAKGWKLPGLKKLGKTQKCILRHAKQAKLHSFHTKPIYMCGFEVPCNHEQAMAIDQRNRNTKFADTENAESFMIDEFSTFEDLGFGGNPGPDYKKTRVHMVYAVKHNGRHKARLVAGGHLTETPIDSVYSSVVSLRGI